MRTSTWLWSSALLLVACSGAPEPLPHAARPVVELARWEVVDGDTQVGILRQLEIRDPRGPQTFYRIEDRHGRWLGHATAAGRFTRRVPFRDEEQDLGVWSLARGTALLVEAKAEVRLQPVALDADVRRR
jgi:hypothetical protein